MVEYTDGTCKYKVYNFFRGGVLPGTVTAFSGSFDSNGYPIDKNTGKSDTDWHLCDGTNGTPDLRSRFIYGGDGTNNGATGGEATHKLTVEEMPSHSHTYTPDTPKNGASQDKGAWFVDAGTIGTQDAVKSRSTDAAGQSVPHNNMPPYYALAYIMRL